MINRVRALRMGSVLVVTLAVPSAAMLCGAHAAGAVAGIKPGQCVAGGGTVGGDGGGGAVCIGGAFHGYSIG